MAGMSDEAVKAATGRNWGEWRSWLDAGGAKDKPHKQIASELQAAGVSGWWAQTVTVGYERLIGRRAVGQRCDGAYSASASRTVTGDLDSGLAQWLALVGDRAEFNGVAAESEPRTSATATWRYWKVDFEDGSRATLAISAKPGDKIVLAMSHDRIGDEVAADRWKLWWKELLGGL